MSYLFIALGGTGYKAVSQLQKDYIRFYESKQEKDPNHYIYIDTDQLTIQGVSEDDEKTTLIDMGTFKPIEHYEGGKKNEITQWFDTAGITIPSTTLKAGAKAYRQLSRMGYFYGQNIASKITEILEIFHEQHKDALIANQKSLDILKVYVVSGTAGGTGSGIFTDLLYSIWRYYVDTHGGSGNLDITAILLMPNMFTAVSDTELQSRYKQNGYAFLEEINAFLRYSSDNNNNDVFNKFTKKQYNDVEKRWIPLSKAIIIDNINPGFKIANDIIYEIIANFLLAYTIGKTDTQNIVNDGENIINISDALESALTNSVAENTNVQYIDIFNSVGMLVTKVPFAEFYKFAFDQLKIDLLDSIANKQNEGERNRIFNEINNFIAEKLENFEKNNLIFSKPKLDKGEKEKLKKIVLGLDFGKDVPKNAGVAKLDPTIHELNNVKTNLLLMMNEVKDYLYKYHKTALSEGVSIATLEETFYALDAQYYAAYNTEKAFFIDDKDKIEDVWQEAVISKVKTHCYYLLSKGSESLNDNGYFDEAKRYLGGIKKEINLFVSSNIDSQAGLIKHLNGLKSNAITQLLPGVERIITKDSSGISVFDEEGVFYKWYNDLQINIRSLQEKCISKFFENLPHTPDNQDIEKFKKRMPLLDEIVNKQFDENQKYKELIGKDIKKIMEEENCEGALSHIKNFNQVFLQTKDVGVIAKTAYAANFAGDGEYMRNLGCKADMDNIPIDSAFFKDKVIKIVFKNKIPIDQYFKFKEIKDEFKRKYTDVKQKNPEYKLPSPFIHKLFNGVKFDGDVYSVLTSVNNIVSSNKFRDLDEELKQDIVKFGLIFLAEYCKEGIECKIFEEGFDNTIVTYDDTTKNAVLKSMKYNTFLKKYIVESSSNHAYLLEKDINIQGEREKLQQIVKFIISNTKVEMATNNTFNCYMKAYGLVLELLNNEEAFNTFLSDFVNTETSEIKKDFLGYLSSSLS